MYDVLRNRYRLTCPRRDDHAWIAVSAFRTVRRLRGAMAPAVFRVEFDCECGDRHEALLTHDRLDYEPLTADTPTTFTNLLTGTRELAGVELGDLAATWIKQGRWPWTFFCHPESALRPGFPSTLRFVTDQHGHDTDRLGVLVRCFSCSRLTVNLVTREHLDVPFHNDRQIAYVPQLFTRDALSVEEAFRHQLDSGRARGAWISEQRAS